MFLYAYYRIIRIIDIDALFAVVRNAEQENGGLIFTIVIHINVYIDSRRSAICVSIRFVPALRGLFPNFGQGIVVLRTHAGAHGQESFCGCQS